MGIGTACLRQKEEFVERSHGKSITTDFKNGSMKKAWSVMRERLERKLKVGPGL